VKHKFTGDVYARRIVATVQRVWIRLGYNDRDYLLWSPTDFGIAKVIEPLLLGLLDELLDASVR